MEDFSSIEVGKSTIEDMLRIAPNEYYMNSSLGVFAQYPMEDGRYILIVLVLGSSKNDTVVHSITISDINRIGTQEPFKIIVQ